jgi:hypothetical protein
VAGGQVGTILDLIMVVSWVGGEGVSRMSEYCPTHYDIMLYILYLALVRSPSMFYMFSLIGDI